MPSSDPTTTMIPAKTSTKPTSIMHKKSNGKDDENRTDEDINDDEIIDDEIMESSTTKHYRHMTLSRGLSKYGPWGYLILGMLLCGGALLVCVLWGKFDFYRLVWFHDSFSYLDYSDCAFVISGPFLLTN